MESGPGALPCGALWHAVLEWLRVRCWSSVSYLMSEEFRLGVVYVYGLLGSSHGGIGRLSGVTRDCSFSKWVCSVSKMV